MRKRNATRSLGLALAVALLACGPTSYVQNRDVFAENIGQRLDALEERVAELQTLMERRTHVDPELRAFVGEIDADIARLRAELAEIELIGEAKWAHARSRITRETRALEQRLGGVHVGDYP